MDLLTLRQLQNDEWILKMDLHNLLENIPVLWYNVRCCRDPTLELDISLLLAWTFTVNTFPPTSELYCKYIEQDEYFNFLKIYSLYMNHVEPTKLTDVSGTIIHPQAYAFTIWFRKLSSMVQLTWSASVHMPNVWTVLNSHRDNGTSETNKYNCLLDLYLLYPQNPSSSGTNQACLPLVKEREFQNLVKEWLPVISWWKLIRSDLAPLHVEIKYLLSNTSGNLNETEILSIESVLNKVSCFCEKYGFVNTGKFSRCSQVRINEECSYYPNEIKVKQIILKTSDEPVSLQDFVESLLALIINSVSVLIKYIHDLRLNHNKKFERLKQANIVSPLEIKDHIKKFLSIAPSSLGLELDFLIQDLYQAIVSSADHILKKTFHKRYSFTVETNNANEIRKKVYSRAKSFILSIMKNAIEKVLTIVCKRRSYKTRGALIRLMSELVGYLTNCSMEKVQSRFAQQSESLSLKQRKSNTAFDMKSLKNNPSVCLSEDTVDGLINCLAATIFEVSHHIFLVQTSLPEITLIPRSMVLHDFRHFINCFPQLLLVKPEIIPDFDTLTGGLLVQLMRDIFIQFSQVKEDTTNMVHNTVIYVERLKKRIAKLRN